MTSNPINLSGKVIMVTGATDGIGQAVALILARQVMVNVVQQIHARLTIFYGANIYLKTS